MDTSRPPSRQLRIFLRDFRMVDATVNLADGQSLASFFANRRAYLTVRDAQWTGTGEFVEQLMLKVSQILWVAAPDGDIALTHASLPANGRTVEILLEGGLLLRAGLVIGEKQRVGDYLESVGAFLPLLHAQLLRSGRPARTVNVQLGDLVVNQEGVQAAWESVVPPPATVELAPAFAAAEVAAEFVADEPDA